nr:TetR/AcrR family transcriptional regulator [Mycobacterium eburneum]
MKAQHGAEPRPASATGSSRPLDDVRTRDTAVRTRLIEAASAEFDERGVDTAIPMDVIARRAGVSRATAFRQLGSVTEVLVHVALLRAERHIAAVSELVAAEVGVFTKIEAAIAYCARELPTDPVIVELMRRGSASVGDARVHAAASDVIAGVVVAGQREGQIRDDIHVDDVVDFLVEQTYLAAERGEVTDDAARARFRRFVVPALAARGRLDGDVADDLTEVRRAAQAIDAALTRITDRLQP